MTDVLSLAHDPRTPAHRLMTLLTHPAAEVQAALASNPNLPKKGLLRLLALQPQRVLENPALELLLLENPRLFAQAPVALQVEWSRCEALPGWLLLQLMDAGEGDVWRELATNRSCPVEGLETMAFPQERAGNEEASRELSVLANPALPDGLRFDLCTLLGMEIDEENLEHFEEEMGDYFLPEQISIDEQSLWVSSQDPGEEDESEASEEDRYTEVLPYQRDARGCFFQPWQAEGDLYSCKLREEGLLPEWSCEEDRSLWGGHRWELASNGATPGFLRRRLLRDQDASVRAAAVGHLRDEPEELRRLASDPSLGVQLAVATHPETPGDALAVLASSESFLVRNAVAAHPNARPETLQRLSADRWHAVRATVEGRGARPQALRAA
ncbi:MAG: hypothetical protein MUF64_11295 [Polyangiaceae bacterium]|jgi:hypothetical protein|nr:hypothetical protein [Polyangiaceae bacterium]